MLALHEKPIELTTPRLRLRVLTPDDVTDEYVMGLNDPEVNQYLVTVRRSRQTRASVVNFVEANAKDPAAVLFGVNVAADLIGTVRVHGVEAENGTATIGICMFSRARWGQGYASEALAAVSEWCLSHLGVRYLEASCYEGNVASKRAFLNAGFTEVARFPDKYLHDGAPCPVVFLKKTAR